MSFGYDYNVVHSDTVDVTQGSLESDAPSLCALLSAERSTPDSVHHTLLLSVFPVVGGHGATLYYNARGSSHSHYPFSGYITASIEKVIVSCHLEG